MAATLELGNLFLIYDDNAASRRRHQINAFARACKAPLRRLRLGHLLRRLLPASPTKVADSTADRAGQTGYRQATSSRSPSSGGRCPTRPARPGVHSSRLGADEISGLKAELGFKASRSPSTPNWSTGCCAPSSGPGAASGIRATRAAALSEQAALLDQVLAGTSTTLTPCCRCSSRARAPAPRRTGAVGAGQAGARLQGGSSRPGRLEQLPTMAGVNSFIPAEHSSHEFTGAAQPHTLRYSRARHGQHRQRHLDGLTRVYCAAFLVFSDHMRTAPRLAALSLRPTTFVWTTTPWASARTGPRISRSST